MNTKHDNASIFSNLVWRIMERCGAQGVRLIVELVLARILMPDDYGVIALVTVFIEILNVFVDSGLGSALIQKRNVDNIDYSTVFYFNIGLSVFLYILLFFSAPFISNFLGKSELTIILRVLGIQLIISGLKNIQQAYVSKTMQFKRFFYATLGGTVGSAIIGIVMAYKGFGVWALVTQHLVNTFVDTFILWITVKWRPQMVFSIERLKKMYSFGWKLLASSLLDRFYSEIRQIIIGKMYSTSDLAYYDRGKKIPYLLISNINGSIDNVLMPVMSDEQDNETRLREMVRRSIKISIYVMAPLMMGLTFMAEPLVRLVITEKWLPCIPYMRVFCIMYIFYPIHTANLNAIKALGRSDVFLKLEVIKKIMGTILLLSSMWFGVMAMAYSFLLESFLGQIINSWPNRKLLNYKYVEQIVDILPCLFLSFFMGIIVYAITFLGFNDLLTILLQFCVGTIVYICCSILFKIDSFYYLLDILKKLFLSKRNKVNGN